MGPKTSTPASVFEKVLRAYGTGGFTYTYVLAQLTRLLANGASPTELLEILRRRELIAPLPEYGRLKVLGLLNDAIGRAAAKAPAAPPPSTSTPPPPQEAEGPAKKAPATLSSVFKKVLNTPESGSLTDTDVVAQLKKLLHMTGASPAALIEILRRRKLIEPLSASIYAEVVGLLNEAIGRTEVQTAAAVDADAALVQFPDSAFAAASWPQQTAVETEPPDVEVTIDLDPLHHAGTKFPPPVSTARAVAEFVRPSGIDLPSRTQSVRSMEERIERQQADYEQLTRTYERSKDAESSATARANAFAAELSAARKTIESEQKRARELDRALTEKIASTDTVRSRSEEVLRESARHQTEMHALRDALAARDAELAARDAQLAAMHREHAKIVPELEARAISGTQQLQ